MQTLRNSPDVGDDDGIDRDVGADRRRHPGRAVAAGEFRRGGDAVERHPTAGSELLLLELLFASLACSAMAVRYYNHAGFISGMPVESEAQRQWAGAGIACVPEAGVLYSWGLRHLILVAPILACLLNPWAGSIAAMLVVLVLVRFDRVAASGAPKANRA